VRIRVDWLQFLKSTNDPDIPAGESVVTGDDFHRVALIVALAVSNPCE
jgi:hypothetical protein